MTKLTETHETLAEESKWDFSDLKALFINCTLKRSPEVSNTSGLADLAVAIMERNGVSVDVVRAVDRQIATGVYPDMTEHGWDRDDWPEIFEKVMAADILVVLSPIWLGEKSSVCTQVIERLYSNSHLLNDAGQQELYVALGGAGAVVIGDERLPLDPEHLVRVDAGTGRVLTSGPDGLRVLCIGAVLGRPYEPPVWTTGSAGGD
jgi:NADPH-dependent FMN reductase